MVTLTTLRGSRGFAMYLDGKQVAELNPTTGMSLAHLMQVFVSVLCDDYVSW